MNHVGWGGPTKVHKIIKGLYHHVIFPFFNKKKHYRHVHTIEYYLADTGVWHISWIGHVSSVRPFFLLISFSSATIFRRNCKHNHKGTILKQSWNIPCLGWLLENYQYLWFVAVLLGSLLFLLVFYNSRLVISSIVTITATGIVVMFIIIMVFIVTTIIIITSVLLLPLREHDFRPLVGSPRDLNPPAAADISLGYSEV